MRIEELNLALADIEVALLEGSRALFREGVMDEQASAKITDKDFDELRPGKRFFMAISDGWGDRVEREFEVGRTTYSKKYDVYSKTLYPVEEGQPVKKGRAKYVMYKRGTGISVGHGGMGVVIRSFRTP